MPTQDTHARDQAAHVIEDNASKMKREKQMVDDLEAELDDEEKVLESIRDSLKGS